MTRPVRLDPWQNIVNVHWRSRPGVSFDQVGVVLLMDPGSGGEYPAEECPVVEAEYDPFTYSFSAKGLTYKIKKFDPTLGIGSVVASGSYNPGPWIIQEPGASIFIVATSSTAIAVRTFHKTLGGTSYCVRNPNPGPPAGYIMQTRGGDTETGIGSFDLMSLVTAKLAALGGKVLDHLGALTLSPTIYGDRGQTMAILGFFWRDP